MRNNKCPMFELPEAQESKHTPELGLLAGVLEMAFRDLNSNTIKQARQSAIKWFRSRELDKNFPEFSFKEVVTSLGLTASQVKTIFIKVEQAEKYEQGCWDKQQEERIKSGVGIGPLVERERIKIRTENAAILRERRNERRGSARGIAELSY